LGRAARAAPASGLRRLGTEDIAVREEATARALAAADAGPRHFGRAEIDGGYLVSVSGDFKKRSLRSKRMCVDCLPD
jgi:hypothetical protein